jgi:membrane protease subunit HflC
LGRVGVRLRPQGATMKRVSLPTLIIGVVVVVIMLCFAFVKQVDFSQEAVQVRLGKAIGVLKEPGLYRRWPWPIDQIKTYDKRLRTLDTSETEIATSDGKNVVIGFYAIWRITDPLVFYQSVPGADDKEAENQMRTRFKDAQGIVIGSRTLSHFVNLNVEETERNYDALLAEMKDLVAPRLAADYGVEVREIGVRRIS